MKNKKYYQFCLVFVLGLAFGVGATYFTDSKQIHKEIAEIKTDVHANKKELKRQNDLTVSFFRFVYDEEEGLILWQKKNVCSCVEKLHYKHNLITCEK